MKISIDISDKAEIAAAIPLLQLLLGYNFTAAQDAESEVVVEPVAQDAAAAFGATPLPPVPFTAGATPPPIAPVVLPGSLPQMPGVLPPVVGGLQPVAPLVNATLPGTPAAAPATGVELDAEGLPWDERIHAGTKTKTVKNVWKAKKGLDDEAWVNDIKNELRARVGGAVPQPQAPAAVVQQPAALPPLGAGPFVPPAAALQPVQPVAPSVPAGPPQNFDEFMPRITAACNANIVPMEAVQAACTAYQLPSITSLQQNPTYVPHVWAYLQQQFPALV